MHRMVAITAFPTAIAAPAPRRSPRPVPPAPLRSVPTVVPPRRLAAVGRGVSWAVVALVAVVAVAYLALTGPAPAVEGIPVQDATHVVEPGETMWSVANEVAPAGEAAAYVERLVEVNGSASVAPGQVLTLPMP
jgi:hypothetical protein